MSSGFTSFNLSGVGMVSADELENIKPVDFNLSGMDVSGLGKTTLYMKRASMAMAGMGMLGQTNNQALKTISEGMMLTYSGFMLYKGYSAIKDALTTIKIAEGTAGLAKYGPLAPVIAVAAVAGAVIVYEALQSTSSTTITGDYSTIASLRTVPAKIQRT